MNMQITQSPALTIASDHAFCICHMLAPLLNAMIIALSRGASVANAKLLQGLISPRFEQREGSLQGLSLMVVL